MSALHHVTFSSLPALPCSPVQTFVTFNISAANLTAVQERLNAAAANGGLPLYETLQNRGVPFHGEVTIDGQQLLPGTREPSLGANATAPPNSTAPAGSIVPNGNATAPAAAAANGGSGTPTQAGSGDGDAGDPQLVGKLVGGLVGGLLGLLLVVLVVFLLVRHRRANRQAWPPLP